MGHQTVNGLGGMRMDRRNMKELSRMGKRFLMNVGMKMGMRWIVLGGNLTVFELGVITRG
jgi:hypothetical protein